VHGKDENSNLEDTRTPVFIAAIFTIVKTWKQPKCPSTDDWFKMILYTHTHTHTHTLAIKKEISPFAATWMDLENIILIEMSDRERQILYDITFMRNLTNNTNEPTHKTETESKI